MGLSLDAATLLRHTRQGPRYTSYPTAPMWREDFPDAAFAEGLGRVRGPTAVYVHIPFCREQCSFCGCNMVVAGRREPGIRYLAALRRQVDELPLPAAQIGVDRIHLGGGTPTWLTPEEMAELFAILDTRFVRRPGCEVSVEADPEVTTEEHLRGLAALGCTRLSFGVQSFDEKVLEAVQRPQQRERIGALMALARSLGMGSLNLDLMYGLPHQSLERWSETLAETIRIRPDRLAVFGYAHLPWLKPHMRRIDAGALPGPLDRAELFLRAHAMLTEAGYQAVGMDHFALPDDALATAQRAGQLHRNFMGYTTHRDQQLIGLGMSAISELDDRYVQQKSKLSHWWTAVETGARVIEKGAVLTAEDKLRRDVIYAIMCNFELSAAEMSARHGVDFWAHFADDRAGLEGLAAEGLVELDAAGVKVPPHARLLVRNVAMCFDPSLRAPQAGGPRFSSTV
jgi:oxygen-independent coproporphyrinogen-3 oxidase